MSLDITFSTKCCGYQVHEQNITHNLGKMAAEAGIYEALWRPQEGVTAEELGKAIEAGIKLMAADSARFKAFDAPNGWGTYDQFIPWLSRLLIACKKHPAAIVTASI